MLGDDPKKTPDVMDPRKFSGLDSDEQKRLQDHVSKSVSDQKQTAQRLIEDFKRLIITANTGGVAATIALIVQTGLSEWFIGGLVIFVLGIITALWWALNLPIRLGDAVGNANRIRVDVMSSKITIGEMNRRLISLNDEVSDKSPVWIIISPLVLFVVGVAISITGLIILANDVSIQP